MNLKWRDVQTIQEIMSLNRSTNLHLWWKITSFLLLLRSSFALNSDGILLLSFKYSILNDPLSVLATWNYDDESPCSWTGITCTQIGNPSTPDMFRVTSLLLPNNQLLGSISPDLGMLEHLHHLDLSNNLFNGSLPSSLFNASKLQVLSLSNNVISGEIPELIGGLRSLQFLNLSENAFSGKVPENLTTLANLTVVSLRSNYFYGSVPSGFAFVEVLDLSSNLLNGSLPMDFDGGSLRYLNLSYNALSGTIPPGFAKGIPENATIDVAFNNLTGEIPAAAVALANQKRDSFSGNLDLCGKPLKNPCSIPSSLSTPPPNVTSPPAIAAIPKTIDSTPLTNSTGTTQQQPQQRQSGLKPGTIVGIAIGDLAAIGILAMIFLFVYQIKKKKRNSFQTSSTTKNEDKTGQEGLTAWSCLTKGGGETSEGTGSDCSDSDGHDNKREYMGGAEKGNYDNRGSGSLVTVDGETKLELETLLKASAYILGASGTSIVYKAVMEDGMALAVRRIGECGVERMRDFENQVRVIAKLRHPNLVRVRGFYWGADEKLVIYDYVSNGSLATAGYKKLGSSPCHLPLEVRLKIARGIARGLTYIHEKKYVHGNIKPTNILLTSDMEPIISDLGLNRLFSCDNSYKADGLTRHLGSKGSFGSRDGVQDLPTGSTSPYATTAGGSTAFASPYHAPESLKNLKPNPKWDVYSFGIILLELLTGKIFSDPELGQWAAGSAADEKTRVLRLADVAIRAEVGRREDAMVACFKLGFSCASLVPQKRPSMKEGLQILEKIPSPSY
ncbi:hypothetical protein L1049_015878 [Liquidambar formosana]|uniref:Protein kinase domain-containing protein n=1 Tax=Liquidambar formosana TaxID=63359 RepID=A0AAP0RYT0_LIQFO